MREVIANTWCDACVDQEERTPGKSITIAVNGEAERSLDLCDRHYQDLLLPLERLLGQYSPPPARASRSAPLRYERSGLYMSLPVDCPICATTRVGVQGMVKHLFRDHGLDLGGSGAADRLFGTTCPLCKAGPFQNMGTSHARFAHPDIEGGAPALFRQAKEAGDPHGVLAENTRRLRALLHEARAR